MDCYPIGIDLGTTFSCVGVYKNGNVEIIADQESGERVIPSHVAFNARERLFGHSAKNQVSINPKNSVFDVKRLIGRDYEDPIVQKDKKLWSFDLVKKGTKPAVKVRLRGEEKTFYPEEISAMILEKMKSIAEAYLGKPVTEAVITVPAYFNTLQKQATKDAATIAGLKVIRLLNEPTAAAIAYGLKTKYKPDRNVLVYDLGGGTFDVSVMRISGGEFRVKATNGDSHLGGEDFDNLMVEHCFAEIQRTYSKSINNDLRAVRRLRVACERAKRRLSSYTEASIEVDNLFDEVDFSLTITRAKFENLCASLFTSTLEPVKKALKDARLGKEEIDEIVIVGGSTRIPKIRNLLETFFSGKKLHSELNPDEAVAYGATIQAAIIKKAVSKQDQKLILHDVAPLSFGQRDANGVMKVFIERNTRIPVKVVQSNWTTAHDDQTDALTQVYEGERGMAEDNEFLGSFTLYGLPPKPKGHVKLENTFEIDADGLLHVTTRCLESGTEAKTTIKKRDGHLTDEMIDLLLVDARKYAEKDKMAVKQANDRILMQLDVERVHIQKEYEHNVSIMAERQKRFNDEIQKRDEEFEKMKNSFVATNKKMMEENRKDKKKLQEDLKKNEKRYRQEVDKFEQKLSRLEKSYGDRLDEQKKELQEAQQRDHLEFKKKQEREHLAYKEEQEREHLELQRSMSRLSLQKDEEIGRLRKEIVDERELNKKRENEFMKIIDKKNYEDKYPKPDLIESHQKINPRACYIQMLGARGSGKSTLLNEIVGDDVAETGTKETTANTAFFNITPYVQNLPKQYDQVFVVDQPGIGGLEVTEARYLSKYGPGHFNLTLLLCKDGFNELELQLLRHLIFNKKPVVIIRSKCDCDIKGIRRKNRAERMTRDEAVEFLKTEFHQYFREKVLPKVSGMRELQKPEIYFIGLDGDGVSYDDYPDYERLTNQIFNGSMLHKLAENEAKNYKDLKNRSESVVPQNSPDYSNMAIVPYGQVTNPNVESQRSSSSGWFNFKVNPFA